MEVKNRKSKAGDGSNKRFELRSKQSYQNSSNNTIISKQNNKAVRIMRTALRNIYIIIKA